MQGIPSCKGNQTAHKKPFWRWIDLIFALIALALLCGVLLVGEPVGLSDNGDFGRIMFPNGISFLESRYAKFALETDFGYNGFFIPTSDWSKYPTLQHPVTRLSVGLNQIMDTLFLHDGLYHLGWLALLHILGMVLALWVLFSGLPDTRLGRAVLMRSLILAVLCDVGYATFFQSFYGEALQIIFLTFVAGFALRWLRFGGRAANQILLLVSLLGFSIAKPANLPIGIGGALLLTLLLLAHSPYPFRKTAIGAGLAFTLLMSFCLVIIPGDISWDTRHNAFFYGLLREAPDKAAVLEEESLPGSLIQYADKHAYVKNVKKDALADPDYAVFDKTVSRLDIGLYYLEHPRLLLDVMELSANHAGDIRATALANLTADHGRMATSSKFEFWGAVRRRLPFDTLPGIGLAWAFILSAWAVQVWVRDRGNRPRILPLVFIAVFAVFSYLYSFMVPYVSNGQADLSKHLLLSCHLLDLMLLFGVGSLWMHPSESRGVVDLDQRLVRKVLPYVPAYAFAIAFLAYSPIQATMADVQWFNGDNAISVGEYVLMGTMKGGSTGTGTDAAFLWEVTAVDGDGADLLAVDLVAMRAFSSDASGKFGNNLWESSAIRSWLNGPFLAQFNAEEQALVVPVEHRTILSSSRSDLFTEGTLEMYWDPVPAWCANGWQDAYATRYVDSVRLPDLTLIQSMARLRMTVRKPAAYWLSDAYYGNATMVRCVTKDGFVTMKDATQELGILPVLTVDPEKAVWKGTGTSSDPWEMDAKRGVH